MKNKPFYVDVSICRELKLKGIRFYLNGVEQRQVISAKSGRNGFIEFYDDFHTKKSKRYIHLTEEFPITIKRGNVRIKINK